jgi:hypothetical protein
LKEKTPAIKKITCLVSFSLDITGFILLVVQWTMIPNNEQIIKNMTDTLLSGSDLSTPIVWTIFGSHSVTQQIAVK